MEPKTTPEEIAELGTPPAGAGVSPVPAALPVVPDEDDGPAVTMADVDAVRREAAEMVAQVTAQMGRILPPAPKPAAPAAAAPTKSGPKLGAVLGVVLVVVLIVAAAIFARRGQA